MANGTLKIKLVKGLAAEKLPRLLLPILWACGRSAR